MLHRENRGIQSQRKKQASRWTQTQACRRNTDTDTYKKEPHMYTCTNTATEKDTSRQKNPTATLWSTRCRWSKGIAGSSGRWWCSRRAPQVWRRGQTAKSSAQRHGGCGCNTNESPVKNVSDLAVLYQWLPSSAHESGRDTCYATSPDLSKIASGLNRKAWYRCDPHCTRLHDCKRLRTTLSTYWMSWRDIGHKYKYLSCLCLHHPSFWYWF